MLLTIAIILLVLWVLGLVVHIGALIHLLLLAAVIVFIYDVLVARRTRA